MPCGESARDLDSPDLRGLHLLQFPIGKPLTSTSVVELQLLDG